MTVSRSLRTVIALGGMALLTNCVSAPPPPAPAPQPTPPPAVPAPQPMAKDWREWPVAKGDWAYRPIEGGTLATFGLPDQTAQLAVRCETATRRLFFARATAAQTRPGDQMTVRTTFGDFQWPVSDIPTVSSRDNATTATFAIAVRAANDSALDKIAYTRGRFAIEAPGAAPLVVPGWAEINRVIEDCRG